MFSRIFNSPTQKLLANALDGSELRNRVTANNIANANTPDFKRSEVLFEEQLRQLVVSCAWSGASKSKSSNTFSIIVYNLLAPIFSVLAFTSKAISAI
jgi:flagellar basal-body rod protein FlgB